MLACVQQLSEKHASVQERAEELEEREAAVERQAAHLQGLQERLVQQDADLHKLSEMLSQRQREEREERDGKVLRVLRNKDQSIATLNGQVEGLERALDSTRSKLAAADRALQDKLKDAEREWRQHTEALTSSNVPRLPPAPSLPDPPHALSPCPCRSCAARRRGHSRGFPGGHIRCAARCDHDPVPDRTRWPWARVGVG